MKSITAWDHFGVPWAIKGLALKKGEIFFFPTIYADKHPLSGVQFISAVKNICFSLSATTSLGLQTQE